MMRDKLMSEKRKLYLGSIKLASGTMLSRIAGFIREILMANYIGGGALRDIFVAAYTIPNLFRRILGEKAMESSFLPVYRGLLSKGETGTASRLAAGIFKIVFISSLTIVLAGLVFRNYLPYITASGFTDSAPLKALGGNSMLSAAVKLSAILLPFLLFSSIFAFLGAVLLSREKFGYYSIIPFFANIFIILFLVAAYKKYGYFSLGYAFVSMAFFECLLAGYFVFKASPPEKNKTANENEYKKSRREVVVNSGPILLDSVVEKAGAVFDIQLASHIAIGSVAALSYARGILLLPFAIISLSINRAILPTFTTRIALKKHEGLTDIIFYGIRTNLFLLLPAAAGLFGLRNEIISVIYERGAFTHMNTVRTGLAMGCYAPALVGMSLVALLSRFFYAMRDTRTPLQVSVFTLCAHIILCFLLYRTSLAHGGIALATSISYLMNAAVLLYLLKSGMSSLTELDYRPLIIPVLKILLNSAIMLAAIMLLNRFLPHAFLFGRYGRTVIIIISGTVVYFLMSILFRTPEVDEISAKIKCRFITRKNNFDA